MLFLPLLLASVLSRMAAAELTFSATAVQRGKEIDTSGLEFVPIPPRSWSRPHFRQGGGSNSTTAGSPPGGQTTQRNNDKRAAISYSADWCGVSQHSTNNNPITSVYGIFSAPNLTQRPGYSYPQYGAAWIGIDGASCQTALLQAGITTVVSSAKICVLQYYSIGLCILEA
jgi:hypothetical protein